MSKEEIDKIVKKLGENWFIYTTASGMCRCLSNALKRDLNDVEKAVIFLTVYAMLGLLIAYQSGLLEEEQKEPKKLRRKKRGKK